MLPHCPHQEIVIDIVEQAFDVEFDNPIKLPGLQLSASPFVKKGEFVEKQDAIAVKDNEITGHVPAVPTGAFRG
jgi:hypothetical protein